MHGSSAPMLYAWFHVAGRSMLRASAGVTSAMCVKARVCSPSPKIVIGSPRRIWRMKIPITLR